MALHTIRESLFGRRCSFCELSGHDREICERINRFNREFAQSYLESQKESPEHFSFHILGYEYGKYLSFRIFKKTENQGAGDPPDICSMVWDLSDGTLCTLSDLTSRANAIRYHKWSFCLRSGKIYLYRKNKRKKKMIHRELAISGTNDIKPRQAT